jgi:hypothetical protein
VKTNLSAAPSYELARPDDRSHRSIARVSVLIERVWGPRSIGLEEGVCEEDELSHDSCEGDLDDFSALVSWLYLAFRSGLKRVATRAGM